MHTQVVSTRFLIDDSWYYLTVDTAYDNDFLNVHLYIDVKHIGSDTKERVNRGKFSANIADESMGINLIFKLDLGELVLTLKEDAGHDVEHMMKLLTDHVKSTLYNIVLKYREDCN